MWRILTYVQGGSADVWKLSNPLHIFLSKHPKYNDELLLERQARSDKEENIASPAVRALNVQYVQLTLTPTTRKSSKQTSGIKHSVMFKRRELDLWTIDVTVSKKGI